MGAHAGVGFEDYGGGFSFFLLGVEAGLFWDLELVMGVGGGCSVGIVVQHRGFGL